MYIHYGSGGVAKGTFENISLPVFTFNTMNNSKVCDFFFNISIQISLRR